MYVNKRGSGWMVGRELTCCTGGDYTGDTVHDTFYGTPYHFHSRITIRLSVLLCVISGARRVFIPRLS